MGQTSSVEDRRPDPRIHAGQRESEVVFLHGMVIWDARLYLACAIEVCDEIEDGEQDGCGLLHAREPPEGPLAVVLLHGSIMLNSSVGDHVHAAVLAVILTRPSCDPERERQGNRGRASA